ncbi:MAG: undecaprenyl-phosphate glucose phosphotransferase [Chloroflexi bacterium]|nr:undecaprenyl-phosphate glucose phosphotransferase [Chloroflexota bacterium]
MSAQIRPPAYLPLPVPADEPASSDERRRAARRNSALRRLGARLAFFCADLLLINFGFLLAFWLRYELRLWPEQGEFFDAPFSAYYLAEALLVTVLVGVFAQRGLYRLRRTMQWLDEVGIIAAGTTVAVSSLVMVFYLFRPGVTSRAMLFYAWISIIVLLSAYRLAVRSVVAHRRRRGIGLSRVLVVGAGRMGKMVMQQIAGRPGLGYVLAGFCDDVAWRQQAVFGRFSCLGSVDNLEAAIAEHRIDEVVIALPSSEHQRILEIVTHCERSDVEFRLVPDTFDMTLGTIEIDHIAGIPLIGLRETPLNGFNQALKRTIDIVVASIALLVLAPVMLVVAVAVKLDSPGPVYFPQERVGPGGRVFRIYKVRSMYRDADQRLQELVDRNEAGGPIFKMKDDPRRTRVGRLVRRLSLDEVPQLWNVLVGDMSLVGPRPPIPHEVEKYDEWHKRRLEVTPGLTGLWQVSGRSDLPFDEMVMLDLYYIENWSLGQDIKIILQTIPAVLSMRGAY